MTQHRSYRSIPLWSWRPGGFACCISNICINLFLRKLSLILSIWSKRKVYFQWKPQQIICWVHTTLTQTFSEGYDDTAHNWDELHLQAGESSQLHTAIPSNDSWGYSSVHTYPASVALPFLTCPGALPFINTIALPALQSHLLNTMSVLLLGKIWDGLLDKQRSKMPIYCLYCSVHLSLAPNFLLVPCLFCMRNHWIYQYYVQTA